MSQFSPQRSPWGSLNLIHFSGFLKIPYFHPCWSNLMGQKVPDSSPQKNFLKKIIPWKVPLQNSPAPLISGGVHTLEYFPWHFIFVEDIRLTLLSCINLLKIFYKMRENSLELTLRHNLTLTLSVFSIWISSYFIDT